MAGNAQQGRVGETLEDPLVVLVTDTQGRPVVNANVVFTVADGAVAGEAVPGSKTTDANGLASVALKLGSRAGAVTGVAEVPVPEGTTPVQAPFIATSLPANANVIALVSGNEQTGTINTALAEPLVVQVTDASGNPISGVAVEWSVAGGGSVSATTTLTGADGRTSVTRTLGPTAGQQTALATATGLVGSPVTFTHTATAGTATGVVKVSGDNQSGSPSTQLALPLVVQVLDAASNPIPNRAVTWVIGTGGGSVAPENTTTDAQGNASTQWTLGPAVGPNTVNAVVSGVGTATFSATATAGQPSASNSTVAASPDQITVTSGSSTITVTVRDAANNPVSGVSVSVASSGSGNTISPASSPTASNGVATFTFSSTVAEVKTITATAGGVTITDQATITVVKAASTTRITRDEPDRSTSGETVRVEFTVTGAGGPPTGTVTITASGGGESCSAPVATGQCDVVLVTPGNPRILTATYSGDDRFNGSSDTENHRVDPLPAASTTTTITSDTPDPSDPGALITVNFTVTSSGGTPTGTVEVTDPLGGGCSASVAAGSCQYTPGGTGTRTITATYQGSSGFTGSADTEGHTVTPPAANTPPTAGDDFITTSSQIITDVPAPGVLANDSDADNGPQTLIARNASDPPQGSVVLNPDGSFTYTPDATAVGSDSFTYEAFDGLVATTATVTLTFAAIRRN